MDVNPRAGQGFVTAYIGDILIYSRTLEEHLSYLRAVMSRLIEAGLKLKPTKCVFVHEEVSYLGHVITSKGLQVSDQHVEGVRNLPRPKGIKGVRQFSGLCSKVCPFLC